MKPGRELDALVAEKVMGYETVYSGANYYVERTYSPVPLYSTDISAAWEVVEKLACMKDEVNVFYDCGAWFCNTGVDANGEWSIERSGSCATAPHAICLAALKAVGYEG